MTTANVHEAKTNLSKLLDAAQRGEEVVITRRGPGVNRFLLVPDRKGLRKQLFGAMAGRIVYASDYDGADGQIEELFGQSTGS